MARSDASDEGVDSTLDPVGGYVRVLALLAVEVDPLRRKLEGSCDALPEPKRPKGRAEAVVASPTTDDTTRGEYTVAVGQTTDDAPPRSTMP